MGNNQDNINTIDTIDKPDSKRSFSNNKINDTQRVERPSHLTDDFQSAHMIHKLKKIKKKKMKHNYNKVKEFDILTNDIPLPNVTEETKNDNKPLSTIQHIKQLIFGTKPSIEPFLEEEYEGVEKREKIIKKGIGFAMNDKIDELYELINSYNTYLAESLVGEDKEYDKKSTERKADIALVRNSIVWLECAFVSSIMVYNWYFAIYYAKDRDIHIPELSKEKLKEWSNSFGPGMIKSCVNTFIYFFEFACWFPQTLDWLLLRILPKTSGYLNGTCNFLFLYLICLFCTKNFAVTFKNFLVDLFNPSASNMFINFMMLLVMILFFNAMFTFQSSGSVTEDATDLAFFFMGGFIWSLFKFIIRFMITFFVSVPAGAVGCGLYLIYMSFFARMTWGKWSYGSYFKGFPTSWTSTSFEDIDIHIRNSKAGFEETDLCNDSQFLAFLYAFLKFIFGILAYFKTHLLKIIYTIMLICITILIAINMSSLAPNKTPLIFFAALTGFAGLVMVITSVIRYWDLNKPTNNTDSSTPDTQNPLK